MSSFIFAIVCVFLGYSMWKFRARPGDEDRDGDPIHGHTNLEIIWTIIPTIIVVAFAFYGGLVLVRNESTPADKMIVKVTGQQFAWTFTYPDGKTSTELALPRGRSIQFDITAREHDVIHSFYVPQFRVKADAVPGIINRTYATPTEDGTFYLVCTELCGIGHSQMRAIVKVMEPSEFESWLQSLPAPSNQSQGGA
jgi:cytochrome c oxidase subunit 2